MRSKNKKASSGETGHPLCAARVENENKNEELKIKIGILAAGSGKAGRMRTVPVFLFLRSKNKKASSEETGHPLCAARVENEKLFERSELFFV